MTKNEILLLMATQIYSGKLARGTAYDAIVFEYCVEDARALLDQFKKIQEDKHK